MKTLIASAGRSGTRYTSYLLSLYGLNIGHERMGSDGMIGWKWIKTNPDRFDLILHQSRSPLSAIRSMMTHDDYLYKQTISSFSHGGSDFAHPLVEDSPSLNPKLLPSMQYWYLHNSEARAIAKWSYKVESLYIPDGPVRVHLLSLLNVPLGTSSPFNEPPLNLNTRLSLINRRGIPEITWEMLHKTHKLLAGEIELLARDLGYETLRN